MSIMLTAKDFLLNTPKGAEFAFHANETGFHCEDGSVSFNERGMKLMCFDSIQSFIEHRFHGIEVPHTVSHCVGERDDTGIISWTNGPYDDSEIDQDEDGGAVFTLPQMNSSELKSGF